MAGRCVPFAGGLVCRVRGARPPAPCPCGSGLLVAFLCDARLTLRSRATCSAGMCEDCVTPGPAELAAYRRAKRVDFCRAHAHHVAAWASSATRARWLASGLAGGRHGLQLELGGGVSKAPAGIPSSAEPSPPGAGMRGSGP